MTHILQLTRTARFPPVSCLTLVIRSSVLRIGTASTVPITAHSCTRSPLTSRNVHNRVQATTRAASFGTAPRQNNATKCHGHNLYERIPRGDLPFASSVTNRMRSGFHDEQRLKQTSRMSCPTLNEGGSEGGTSQRPPEVCRSSPLSLKQKQKQFFLFLWKGKNPEVRRKDGEREDTDFVQ